LNPSSFRRIRFATNWRHRLVIAGPAPIKEAVLLEERERIERPVLALRFDDVEMGQQEKRFPAPSTQPRDEIPLFRIRSEHLHVGRWEAGVLQPRRDRFRRRVTLPAGVSVVLISMSSLKISRARDRLIRSARRRRRR
jgi:hypothetical protein